MGFFGWFTSDEDADGVVSTSISRVQDFGLWLKEFGLYNPKAATDRFPF